MNLGRKLYKTSMLNFVRLPILAIIVIFFHDFYLETFSYPQFQTEGRFQFIDVFMFHYRYPAEFLSFFFLSVGPMFYFAVIRGTRFYEHGFIINRGIPFLNRTMMYSDIKSYKLLHPDHALSLKRQDEEYVMIVDNKIERVLAILDQHDIPGDIHQDEYVKLMGNAKKFFIMVVVFLIFLFVIKKLGVFQFQLPMLK